MFSALNHYQVTEANEYLSLYLWLLQSLMYLHAQAIALVCGIHAPATCSALPIKESWMLANVMMNELATKLKESEQIS